MKDAIEAAIKALKDKSVAAIKADDALKFSQAALNLAHAFATLDGGKSKR
jgi:hypothetical protein